MRVARLLIYEGPDKAVQEQLGKSTAQGVRRGLNSSVTLTVVDMPATFLTLLDEVGERVAQVGAQEPQPISGREAYREAYQAQAERADRGEA